MYPLHIFDEIDPLYGIGAGEFTAGLPSNPAVEVELHINSPGGLAFDGLAIYNVLRQRTGLVRVVVDGLCASIATVIAMAASPGELLTAPGSTWMIHEAHTLIAGRADELRKMADTLDMMSGMIAELYQHRTGIRDYMWRDKMAAETWYTGAEAVAAGLADRVLERVAA